MGRDDPIAQQCPTMVHQVCAGWPGGRSQCARWTVLSVVARCQDQCLSCSSPGIACSRCKEGYSLLGGICIISNICSNGKISESKLPGVQEYCSNSGVLKGDTWAGGCTEAIGHDRTIEKAQWTLWFGVQTTMKVTLRHQCSSDGVTEALLGILTF